ncbi:hypothetical protein Thein_1573 [Thermodesulfatator indicus DSM 15286]|uniref:Sporadically distributed protein, TIGR04141 family n=1 Tax=Thermodesulfatator indicus (strain DSM 15286 / JCM 11887 / CIR29812) TaxID=667014 RepID=F8AAS2_THEID|nr:hypothetical protein Thein_1573 [Thermodesulfatator indicus DSM 15286]
MSSTKKKTQKLTVLLLKDNISSFQDALRNPDALKRIPLRSELPFEGEFWYSTSLSRPPKWIEFIQPSLDLDLNEISVSNASGVLFIKTEKRIFAFTFGYGRNLLKPDCYELNFGLKVVLNRIHPNRLRSLDLRTYEDMMLATRKQTSRGADLGVFGLDVSRDLLRAVTGEPEDEAFAKRLTGADALTFTAQITIDQLGEKCKQILEAYYDNRYKQYFGWVDYLNEVRDPSLIKFLNSKLEEAIKNKNIEKLHLAPPEVVDWQSIDKFRITGTRQQEYDDLDIEEYLNVLGDKTNNLTVEKLKSYRVSVRWINNEQFQDKWSLFNCIVWEIIHEGRLYVLIEGKWFEIDSSFAERVKSFVQSIPPPVYNLPTARTGERESEYNLRVAQEDDSFICLDKILVKPTDAVSSIEFCDLLSDKKQIIHVKKKTRSATLSHLFAQGTVSARVFLQDSSVREKIREKIATMDNGERFLELIPDASQRPNPSSYEVTYVIISKKIGSDVTSLLPFFSQLNLMQNARFLQGMGYKVALQLVAEEEC